MFRMTAVRVHSVLKSTVLNAANASKVSAPVLSRFMSKHSTETDEQFDSRYESYFNRKDIDGWEIRQGINDLCGHDLVPEPRIVVAALKACRRVNDYALAVRILEAIKDKCGSRVNEIYPWYINEIKPTLTELGVETPEELGFDKPELALESVFHMH